MNKLVCNSIYTLHSCLEEIFDMKFSKMPHDFDPNINYTARSKLVSYQYPSYRIEDRHPSIDDVIDYYVQSIMEKYTDVDFSELILSKADMFRTVQTKDIEDVSVLNYILYFWEYLYKSQVKEFLLDKKDDREYKFVIEVLLTEFLYDYEYILNFDSSMYSRRELFYEHLDNEDFLDLIIDKAVENDDNYLAKYVVSEYKYFKNFEKLITFVNRFDKMEDLIDRITPCDYSNDTLLYFIIEKMSHNKSLCSKYIKCLYDRIEVCFSGYDHAESVHYLNKIKSDIKHPFVIYNKLMDNHAFVYDFIKSLIDYKEYLSPDDVKDLSRDLLDKMSIMKFYKRCDILNVSSALGFFYDLVYMPNFHDSCFEKIKREVLTDEHLKGMML